MTIFNYMDSAAMATHAYPGFSIFQGAAEWLIFLGFINSLGKREYRKGERLVIHFVLFAACLFLNSRNFRLIVYFPLYLLLWIICILLTTRSTVSQAVMKSCIFGLDEEMCRFLCRDILLTLLLSYQDGRIPVFAAILLCTILHLLLLGLSTHMLSRTTESYEKQKVSFLQLCGFLLPLVIYVLLRQAVFMNIEQMSYGIWIRMELLQLAIAVCAELSYVTVGTMLSLEMEKNELLEQESLYEKQMRQYQTQQNTIEAVNRRYHDLKHYIAVMESRDTEEMDAYLKEMRQEIEPYECMKKTGNSTLDILLAERVRECQKKGIRLVPYVDGRFLGFMNTLDLCVIFGNAMDNAIEATEKVRAVNKKEINVKIARSDQFVIFTFRNYFEGELRLKNDVLQTSKKEVEGHGYGLSNIRAAAEKYGGTFAYETEGQEFTLNVLIPYRETKK